MTKDGGHAMKALNHVNANDGTFFVDVETFKKSFSDMSGLYYSDNEKRGHRMASWDRRTSVRNLAWKFNNPVRQRVSFQASAPQRRMFKNDKCQSRFQSEDLVFRIRGQSGYSWTGRWMNIDNLPAGDYEVYVSQGSPKSSGVMDFGLSAVGSVKAPTWAE